MFAQNFPVSHSILQYETKTGHSVVYGSLFPIYFSLRSPSIRFHEAIFRSFCFFICMPDNQFPFDQS